MTSKFPSEEWLNDLHARLNSDAQYAHVARSWEGEVNLVIEPDDQFSERVALFLDLWHGASREVAYLNNPDDRPAPYIISAPFTNWLRILRGELNPIQAMATMKLKVKGNMAYIMRNVPVVLDFARVAQETPFHL